MHNETKGKEKHRWPFARITSSLCWESYCSSEEKVCQLLGLFLKCPTNVPVGVDDRTSFREIRRQIAFALIRFCGLGNSSALT